MVIEEKSRKGVLHYSDAGMQIRQVETGHVYDSADDVLPCPYTYEETDTPIESGMPTTEDYEDALSRLGVSQ